MNNLHNPNSYENLDPYNQERHVDNFMSNHKEINNTMLSSNVHYGNLLKKQEIEEQRLMRKAYCKANDIPYEEPEEIPGLSQGSLKVMVIVVWLFIVGTVISSFIGEGNFLTNFMKVWF